MDIALGLLSLAAVVSLVSALSDRFSRSAPLVLVLVGVLGSYLPFVPPVALEPELVLVGLLPPLLYSAAIRTSLLDFRANRRSIGLLSVGYVTFAAVGVGFVAHWVFGVSLASGFALGAVVAPPDAVAATAVARRIGLPRRVIDILEGESLLNDATALVLLRTALAAIAGTVSVGKIAGDFVLAAGGGVAIGVLIALVATLIRRHIKDVVRDTTLSLATPFVAYIAAEEIKASGVLAVVVAGVLIGHKSPVVQSGASRVSERTNWATIQFLLENSVFLLIGLQVRSIVEAVQGDTLGASTIWWGCGLILLTVLVMRPVWVFPATYLPRWLIPAVARADPSPPWQYPAVISWAGMRGVVTLAAVFILPADLPHRAVLVLAALVVVGGTLILQGFTLPTLVRAIGIRGPDPREDLLQLAAVLQETSEAGLAELERAKLPDDPPSVLALLRERMQQRSQAAWERLGRPESDGETPSQRFIRLRLQMLSAERGRVLELRNQPHMAQHVLSEVLEVLDVEESLIGGYRQDEDRNFDQVLLAPEPIGGGCDHLIAAPVSFKPNTAGYCEDCIREGTEPVHLRMCLTCGNVGCCDSSEGKHADRHYDTTGHPVMRSIEPGEAWRWCYVDQLLG